MKVSDQPSCPGDLPRATLQDTVAQQAQPEGSQVAELALGGLSFEFAAPHAAVELGQYLRAEQRGCQQLVPCRHHRFEIGQVNGDIGADHESCHCVLFETRLGQRSDVALAMRRAFGKPSLLTLPSRCSRRRANREARRLLISHQLEQAAVQLDIRQSRSSPRSRRRELLDDDRARNIGATSPGVAGSSMASLGDLASSNNCRRNCRACCWITLGRCHRSSTSLPHVKSAAPNSEPASHRLPSFGGRVRRHSSGKFRRLRPSAYRPASTSLRRERGICGQVRTLLASPKRQWVCEGEVSDPVAIPDLYGQARSAEFKPPLRCLRQASIRHSLSDPARIPARLRRSLEGPHRATDARLPVQRCASHPVCNLQPS